MKIFLQQTRVVYLKSFTYYSKPNNFFQLFWIPFCFGLIAWRLIKENSEEWSSKSIVLLDLSTAITTINYLNRIVDEKQNGQKENQQVMGLSLSSYYAGWILSSLTWTCVSASFYIFMIQIYGILSIENYFSLLLLFKQCIQCYCFSFATVAQMLLISSFFLDVQKGTYIYCLIILLICYLLYFLDILTMQFTVFVFPQVLMFYYYMELEEKNLNINYITTLIILTIQGILGTILYIYFDQIIPNEFGRRKKQPNFIFKYLKRKNVSVEFDADLELQESIQINSGLINMQQQAENQEQAETCIIQISQLTKNYNDESVVKNLSLNLYKNQIFTLLGHNGAGKSTAINMICGSIEKDSGKIQINGLDIDRNLEEIRQNLGYCPQKDIIYDYFTVKEHLNYYGGIKILNKQLLSDKIQNILNMFDLQQEKNLIGKKLSSAGKRKLSLAIALIGDPKVLILDEPTTGLDLVSRQQIWNVLKLIKQDRCVILTTHYLDEAEELSDCIGIIQQGKLVVYGTVDSIKKQFSVGFNISIEFEDINHKQQVMPEIEQIVSQTFRTDINIASQNKAIRLNIPSTNKDIIAQILEQIESIKNINLVIQMSTLEDAYIKIHSDVEQEERFLQENLEFAKSLGNHVLQCDFQKQVKSFFLRRIWIAQQNKKQFLFYIFLWILIICANMHIDQLHLDTIPLIFFWIKLFTIYQQAYYPLYEKEHKIKQSYLSYGASIITYWISNLLFDFLIIIFEQLVVLFVLIITNYLNYYEYEEVLNQKFQLIYKIIIINIVFSIAFNCITYFLTYFFSTPKQIPALALFFYIYQYMIALYFSDYSSNMFFIEVLAPTLSYIIHCFPFGGHQSLELSPSQMVSLLGSAFHFSLILLLEYIKFDLQRPESTSDCTIQPKNKFQKKLSNISFQVKQKQIFGLLGPHGSGKTQLFDIISRQINPSEGQVTIKNEVTEFIVVPSYSPLHNDLNTEQHLRIYGSIKGLQDFETDFFIQKFCEIMNLNRIMEEKRRKIQLGIALIRGSKVLLMDEPTSGVDPLYRQKFQQIMVKHCQINSGSLLFTTQSMSDAQKICDVLLILINGQLRFVGTFQQLRQLCHNRIQFSFKMNSTHNIQELELLIHTNFQINRLQISEERNNYYSIFIDSSQIQLSQLFRFCQNQSVQALIHDFQISSVTLDQIYKQYICQQENVDQPQVTKCCLQCCCQE